MSGPDREHRQETLIARLRGEAAVREEELADLRARLDAAEQELFDLRAIRDALTPPELPWRPGLEEPSPSEAVALLRERVVEFSAGALADDLCLLAARIA